MFFPVVRVLVKFCVIFDAVSHDPYRRSFIFLSVYKYVFDLNVFEYFNIILDKKAVH